MTRTKVCKRQARFPERVVSNVLDRDVSVMFKRVERCLVTDDGGGGFVSFISWALCLVGGMGEDMTPRMIEDLSTFVNYEPRPSEGDCEACQVLFSVSQILLPSVSKMGDTQTGVLGYTWTKSQERLERAQQARDN